MQCFETSKPQLSLGAFCCNYAHDMDPELPSGRANKPANGPWELLCTRARSLLAQAVLLASSTTSEKQ